MMESHDPPQIGKKLKKLRRIVGGLKAEEKDGVAFKVKSAATLMKRVRRGLDRLDLNLIPYTVDAKSLDVAKGTGAAVTTTFMIQDLEDGSFQLFAGYGQGADSQDKAGGKAFTYAWKAALVYLLSLPDSDMPDTDDDDSPGGKDGLKRGKNEVAPGEAMEQEAVLLGEYKVRLAGAATAEDLAKIISDAMDARDAKRIGQQAGVRVTNAVNKRRKELGI
jgi:hypothetical protein